MGNLFDLPLDGLSDSIPSQQHLVRIPDLLRNIMKRTKISIMTIVVALLLLKRLKNLHPSSRGTRTSVYRLVFSSVLVASKIMYDDTYDNRAWSTVSLGLFTLSDVNLMERDILYFLDYRMFVSREEWTGFLKCLGQSMSTHFKDRGLRLPLTYVSSPSLYEKQQLYAQAQYSRKRQSSVHLDENELREYLRSNGCLRTEIHHRIQLHHPYSEHKKRPRRQPSSHVLTPPPTAACDVMCPAPPLYPQQVPSVALAGTQISKPGHFLETNNSISLMNPMVMPYYQTSFSL